MVAASASNDRQSTTPPRWAVAVLIVLTVLVRGGAVWTASGTLRDDPDGYRGLARSLVASGGGDFRDELDRTAYRPPAYPVLLAAIGGHKADFTLPVALLHLVLGIATVWLTYRVGQRWGLGNFALLAAALVACDPILLQQSRLVMTETLATFLAVVLLHLLTTAAADCSVKNVVLAAAAGGAAVLCRPTFLPVVVVAPLFLAVMNSSTPARLATATVYWLALAVALAPWVAWTTSQLGVPVVTTTHGGYTLLLGNNPSFYDYLRNGRWGTVWDAGELQNQWQATTAAIRAETDSEMAAEVRIDRAAYWQAWEHIGREPAMFFSSCLVRCGRFWGPLPHSLNENEGTARRMARWMIALWYAFQFGLALWGACVLRARLLRFPWLWGVLLVATFTAVHTVYWSNLRMRAPVMPVVAMLAAAGLGVTIVGGKSVKA